MFRPESEESHLTPDVRARIAAVIEEGLEIYDRFDRTVRERSFHPFVAADYGQVLERLIAIRESDARPDTTRTFLELGSATGVITIIADLLGFDAVGIELDASLVDVARRLAARYESKAQFAVGSFLPAGYRWRAPTGDARMGTIGSGPSAYLQLGRALDDFDVVYAYPWDGESSIIIDLVTRYGGPDVQLLLMDPVEGLSSLYPNRISSSSRPIWDSSPSS